MAEFEDKLNAILGDPEAMGQILSIAKALTGEGGSDGAAPATAVQPSPESPAAPPPPSGPADSAQPDWSAVLGLLGGQSDGSPLSALGSLDPKLIQTALTLFAEYSAADDRKIALLTALKPFVRPERYAKVDKAVQIARLSRVIRVAFQLFQNRAEEVSGDV